MHTYFDEMADKKGYNLSGIWRKKKRSGHFKRTKAKAVSEILKGERMNVLSDLIPKIISVPTSSLQESPQFRVNNAITSEPSISIAGMESLNPVVMDPLPTENDVYIEEAEQDALEFDKEKYSSEIVVWAIKHRINNMALRDLLGVWNENVPLPELPRDPRTLLRTPRMVDIFTDPDNPNEKYWNYGLAKSLLTLIPNVLDRIPSKIRINVHVDGLPISDSSNECFWPILYNIHEMPEIPPQVISIYHGKSKNANDAPLAENQA